MTGENHPWSARSSVQPGGRAPAPGSLALVQAFINTHYDLEINHGADLLGTPRGLGDWLQAHRLLRSSARVREHDLVRAVTVREGLRALARAGTDSSPELAARKHLNSVAESAAAEVRFTAHGPAYVLCERGGVASALGLLLALAATAMVDGSWARLKVCPGEDCGWAFYDHSRNQTGRWCSMSVCGGRAKARAHYARIRGRS